MAAWTNPCPKHPRYQHKRKPRSTCEKCWCLWILHGLRRVLEGRVPAADQSLYQFRYINPVTPKRRHPDTDAA